MDDGDVPHQGVVDLHGLSRGGYVARAELLRHGYSRRAIEHRLATGILLPTQWPGIYALGRQPVLPVDRAHGARLASGPEAVLSDRTAGSAWGYFKDWREPFEVTLLKGDRRPKGVIVHHRVLQRRDVRTQLGLRVTSAARTCLDLMPGFSDAEATRVLSAGRLSGYLTIPALLDVLRRYPRHAGKPLTERLIGVAPAEPWRSGWEPKWVPFAKAYKLPAYVTNVQIGGCRPDVYFFDHGVVVEMDGWETHGTHAAFKADRELDRRLLARLDVVSVRITHRDFHARPAAIAADLHAILERRRGWAPPAAASAETPRGTGGPRPK
jgi:hypothetical protein